MAGSTEGRPQHCDQCEEVSQESTLLYTKASFFNTAKEVLSVAVMR